VTYAHPDDAPLERDLVIEASASEEGLQVALASAVTEGEIVVASWFGDRPVSLPLGADFHSRRLTIRSSQVGMVSPRRRGSRSTRDRLALALWLLRDPAFDALLTGNSSFRDLPEVMAAVADGSSPGLCHTIDWKDAE
jgi:threonine dehydrogenase-like Zn-dependent dehydrogenase